MSVCPQCNNKGVIEHVDGNPPGHRSVRIYTEKCEACQIKIEANWLGVYLWRLDFKVAEFSRDGVAFYYPGGIIPSKFLRNTTWVEFVERALNSYRRFHLTKQDLDKRKPIWSDITSGSVWVSTRKETRGQRIQVKAGSWDRITRYHGLDPNGRHYISYWVKDLKEDGWPKAGERRVHESQFELGHYVLEVS